MCDGLAGTSTIPSESVDDQADDREAELGTKSSVEACSSPSCLSPRASTDALLPSFQPDDDVVVTSPQLSPSAEHSSRNYPGSAVPQFRRNRSPRSDEAYPGPGHAYAGHSPWSGGQIMPSSIRRSSFSEQVPCGSLHNGIVVEDLTANYPKLDQPFIEAQDRQNRSPHLGDMRKEMIVRSKMDLLRVDTSPAMISRQSRDSAAEQVSCISVICARFK